MGLQENLLRGIYAYGRLEVCFVLAYLPFTWYSSYHQFFAVQILRSLLQFSREELFPSARGLMSFSKHNSCARLVISWVLKSMHVGGTSVREDQKNFQPVVCLLLLVNLVVCLTCCVGCPSALITSRCLFFDEADEMLSRGFKDQVNSSILFLLSLYLIMVPVFFASKCRDEV